MLALSLYRNIGLSRQAFSVDDISINKTDIQIIPAYMCRFSYEEFLIYCDGSCIFNRFTVKYDTILYVGDEDVPDKRLYPARFLLSTTSQTIQPKSKYNN